MPLRIITPLTLFLLAFALVVGACGDDDDEDSSPTPSADASASATPSESEPAETDVPEDEKTPGSEETPEPGETADPNTDPPATPNPGGTPAVAPTDQAGFLSQFTDATIDLGDCTFDPSTLIAGCGQHGDFAVDPPLTGQDVSCQVGLADGAAVFVQCSSQDPLTTIYYDIQG
jgi:hypothetical protein